MHLIDDKEDIFAFERLCQILYFGFIKRFYATFTLYELYHYRYGMIVYERFDLIDIFRIDKTVRKRTEVVVHLLLPRRFDGGNGATVKRVFEGDDLVAFYLAVHFPVFSCDLDRPLVRFGTAVSKKTLHVVPTCLNHLLRRFCLWSYLVKVGNMDDVFGLLTQRI